jgi:hypothetical protein
VGLGRTGVEVTVEIDLSGTVYGGSPTWTDVTGYVLTVDKGEPIQITWGRQDWAGDVGAASCSLTLDNRDGRFTPGLETSPYYPNVRRRARCRVRADVTVPAGGLSFTTNGDGTYTVTGPDGFAFDTGAGTFLMLVGAFIDNGDGTYTYSDDPVTTTVYLFDGLIDSWDTAWENGIYGLTQVSATDMLGRFGSVPIRAMLYEEILKDNPGAFYPFNDQGPTLGNITDASAFPPFTVMLGSGAPDVAYQNVTGCADETVSGVGLGGFFSYIAADPGHSIGYTLTELFFTTTFTGATCTLIGDSDPDVGIGIDANGYITDGTNTGPFVADGQIHHIGFGPETLGVGNWYCDGTLVGSIEFTNMTYFAFNFVGTVFCLVANGTTDRARWAQHLECARTGFAGESTDAHIARLLGYRTNFGRALERGLGRVGAHATDGVALQQALYDSADAEGSVVFVDGQARVAFRNRAHLFSPVPALVLDAAAGEVDATTVFTDSTQFLVNDMTVTGSSGATQRYFDQDSIDADGESAQSMQIIVDDDAELLAAAKWRVQVGVQEQIAATQLDIDLFTMTEAAIVQSVLQAQPLDVVKLLNLPSTTPTVDEFMIQGGSFSIGAEEFQASLFTTVIPAGDPY